MMKAFKILFLALFALVSTQSVGQQQLFLNQTGGAPPPTPGLLDQYKGAAFAAAPDVLLYSTYSATDDIAGSLTNSQQGQWSVAVFRDFDDAIKSFTPAEVADGTANTWVQELGPSDGFVRRWYDQSVTVLDVSNLNHADQTDPTKMPKLFDSSTGLILENGKAAMEFNGVNNFLETSTIATFANASYFIVSSLNSSGTFKYIFSTEGNSSPIQTLATYRTDGSGDSNKRYVFNLPNLVFYDGVNTFQLELNSLFFPNSSPYLELYINSALQVFSSTPSNAISPANKTLAIGHYDASNANYLLGKLMEFVMYPSDQSANRTAIETAINNEYSIYP